MSLPQAVGGALWANPEVYAQVPLHVVVSGAADSVEVEVGGITTQATDEDGDGQWIAEVSLEGLEEGMHPVVVQATTGGKVSEVTAELGVGTQGVQLTFRNENQFSGTPRVHRVGDALWVTWTDRLEPQAEAWMRQVDGAGRWVGERIRLVGSQEQTIYARAAFGNESVGIVYQQPGGPYVNYFKVTDTSGTELMAPIALDPEGWYGSYGGAIAFDGSGFVFTWRVNQGSGVGRIYWMRVEEGSHGVTGPVVIAEAGNNDPHGGFDPFSFLSIAATEQSSVVSFVRKYWVSDLEFAIPKSQIAFVGRDGSVTGEAFLGSADDYFWHKESRVFQVEDEWVALWATQDLTDPQSTIPVKFQGARAQGGSPFGAGSILVQGPEGRTDPVLTAHPEHLGLLAWVDSRSYENDLLNGRLELYGAPVTDALGTGPAVTFGHAQFIESTSQLRMSPAGTNGLLFWLDERNGSGIVDPATELWFETLWY